MWLDTDQKLSMAHLFKFYTKFEGENIVSHALLDLISGVTW